MNFSRAPQPVEDEQEIPTGIGRGIYRVPLLVTTSNTVVSKEKPKSETKCEVDAINKRLTSILRHSNNSQTLSMKYLRKAYASSKISSKDEGTNKTDVKDFDIPHVRMSSLMTHENKVKPLVTTSEKTVKKVCQTDYIRNDPQLKRNKKVSFQTVSSTPPATKRTNSSISFDSGNTFFPAPVHPQVNCVVVQQNYVFPILMQNLSIHVNGTGNCGNVTYSSDVSLFNMNSLTVALYQSLLMNQFR
ncbi:hypothetical protein FQR65_LT13908 [Abscondita terminalis]|nr:hypothetical protein FQR65_LT13908 [Abscondita terminalis]